MKLHLSGPPSKLLRSSIQITGSKSESNRLLLLKALYPNISILNVSNSDDASVMQQGLLKHEGEVDIHHAGTAMRFLTAFFASQQGRDVVLTGSSRMQERPVKILVEALQSLGAEISYTKNTGYPPIRIKGRKLDKHHVQLPANVSSQYISALLLVAPQLEHGLELELVGEITSIPYIKMTLALLAELGIESEFKGNIIKVHPKVAVADREVVVESDWSSASYFYSIIALSEIGSEIVLSAYKEHSLQGDSALVEYYRGFGVETTFEGNSMSLRKVAGSDLQEANFDLTNSPDLAQTIVVSCFGLGIGCHLTGLHTLKIKETDRLVALHTELTKFGADISITENSLTLKPSGHINSDIAIDTYNDHRMAMAFAPLAMKTRLVVNDAEVVSKSYPDFWKDLERLQFEIKKL
ncbi:MAG: 3-phosphoshikimate 1-carboxyvinyltransferase [Flavobacteriaceae bacterium]